MAQTSYAYWVATERKLGDADDGTSKYRTTAALRECRRHYIGENRNVEKTRVSLQNMVEYRRERRLDLFRTCMNPDAAYETKEEEDMAKLYRLHLELEAQRQVMVVRGRDNDSRAIVLKFPRQAEPATPPEAYVTMQLYILERAIAATEILSDGGEQEKLVGVFDFANYQSSNQPPLTSLKTILTLLQRHYPERLKNMFVLNPPFWMRMVYRVLLPFLDDDTKEKLQMLTEESERVAVLGGRIGKDQAMPFMLPDGQLTSEVDATHFLSNVPFHQLYDDVPITAQKEE
mmetsp:Transcript_7811/g.11368  ORF Transcript_7811/g.11368 Transcript_7811/m.11368 type:complete len:288 (+) Transcript_7811:329-1192(+)